MCVYLPKDLIFACSCRARLARALPPPPCLRIWLFNGNRLVGTKRQKAYAFFMGIYLRIILPHPAPGCNEVVRCLGASPLSLLALRLHLVQRSRFATFGLSRGERTVDAIFHVKQLYKLVAQSLILGVFSVALALNRCKLTRQSAMWMPSGSLRRAM